MDNISLLVFAPELALQLVLEGSGNVTYHGSPAVSSRLDGSGNLTQAD